MGGWEGWILRLGEVQFHINCPGKWNVQPQVAENGPLRAREDRCRKRAGESRRLGVLWLEGARRRAVG